MDFQRVTKELELKVTPEINQNRAEQVYYINGTEFAFYGLDYPQKLHGRSQDRFWINETIECSKNAFNQLEMRTRKGGILDYNPSDDLHWIFDVHKRDDVIVHHSTMLDNPFLPDTIVSKIKSYEPTEENIRIGTADNYMWEVYGLGLPAKLQGSIFTNWEIVESIPWEANQLGLGLDFGYSNHPSALIDVYQMNDEIYLDELIYEPELTNPDINKRMEDIGLDKSVDIIADSAEPKSIDELVNFGWNVRGAKKGADSINFGVDLMKSKKIHITARSDNLIKEFRRYCWATDKTGKSLNKPIDAYNHGIDATRYLVMEKLGQGVGIQFHKIGI